MGKHIFEFMGVPPSGLEFGPIQADLNRKEVVLTCFYTERDAETSKPFKIICRNCRVVIWSDAPTPEEWALNDPAAELISATLDEDQFGPFIDVLTNRFHIKVNGEIAIAKDW